MFRWTAHPVHYWRVRKYDRRRAVGHVAPANKGEGVPPSYPNSSRTFLAAIQSEYSFNVRQTLLVTLCRALSLPPRGARTGSDYSLCTYVLYVPLSPHRSFPSCSAFLLPFSRRQHHPLSVFFARRFHSTHFRAIDFVVVNLRPYLYPISSSHSDCGDGDAVVDDFVFANVFVEFGGYFWARSNLSVRAKPAHTRSTLFDRLVLLWLLVRAPWPILRRDYSDRGWTVCTCVVSASVRLFFGGSSTEHGRNVVVPAFVLLFPVATVFRSCTMLQSLKQAQVFKSIVCSPLLVTIVRESESHLRQPARNLWSAIADSFYSSNVYSVRWSLEISADMMHSIVSHPWPQISGSRFL